MFIKNNKRVLNIPFCAARQTDCTVLCSRKKVYKTLWKNGRVLCVGGPRFNLQERICPLLMLRSTAALVLGKD